MKFKTAFSLLAILIICVLCICHLVNRQPDNIALQVISAGVSLTEYGTEDEEAIPSVSTAPPTEPATDLHSGIREDKTFDEGTLFIGDSLTYGLVDNYLKENGLLGDAKYMAMSGAAVTAFIYGPGLTSPMCVFSPEFEGLTFSEAAELAGDSVTAIYFMLGTNHSDRANADTYVSIVEYLLEVCPNATVYLQKVPFSTSDKINYMEANRRILAAYDHFVRQENSRVLLIDTQTAIGHALIADGIHLSTEGQENWYHALLAFAEENQIPQ